MTTDRKVFADSVIPLQQLKDFQARGLVPSTAQPVDPTEKMRVHFLLGTDSNSLAELRRRVEAGEYVSPQEQSEKYAPRTEDSERLQDWLKSQGFTINETTLDGIYADATVGQISQSLRVHFNKVTRDGLTYTAAVDAPSLPTDVGNPVQAIIGLQPFRRANKHLRRAMPLGGNRVQATNGAPQTNVQNTPPFLVSEIMKAYGADRLTVTGNGQTIAILIDTFPNDSDLAQFWKLNGLPDGSARIQKVNVTNAATLPPQEGEESLDVEWTSSIAQGATIRIYASGSLNFAALDQALDRILSDAATIPGMRQLSISLGLGEAYMGGPNGEVAAQSTKYLRLAGAGINVFVSTGDAGSNPDQTGQSSTGPLQVEYASSDPSVVAVGGTSLVLNPDGTVASETGWSGGGGGVSGFFQRPSWQVGAGVPAGTMRLVPDVSSVADPQTGALLVVGGNSQQIGGTSWSAPQWAAFCALINEGRLAAGKSALTFLNPQLYPLLGTGAFRDITSGTNGGYNAGPGYDMVTGIGVPNVAALMAALP